MTETTQATNSTEGSAETIHDRFSRAIHALTIDDLDTFEKIIHGIVFKGEEKLFFGSYYPFDLARSRKVLDFLFTTVNSRKLSVGINGTGFISAVQSKNEAVIQFWIDLIGKIGDLNRLTPEMQGKIKGLLENILLAKDYDTANLLIEFFTKIKVQPVLSASFWNEISKRDTGSKELKFSMECSRRLDISVTTPTKETLKQYTSEVKQIWKDFTIEQFD
jgi:hypothetical protein